MHIPKKFGIHLLHDRESVDTGSDWFDLYLRTTTLVLVCTMDSNGGNLGGSGHRSGERCESAGSWGGGGEDFWIDSKATEEVKLHDLVTNLI